MILIDATYIHSYGGASILQALINKLNQTESTNKKKLFFLLDERLDLNQLNGIRSYKILKIRATHFNRKKAYKAILQKIEKVICLANVPPPVKINKKVYIYFHNLLLLKRKIIFSSFFFLLVGLIKLLYIRFYNSSRYNWVVQTKYMKEELGSKLKVNSSMIWVLPFYEVEDIHFQNKDFNKNELTFLCVTSNSKHKNLKKVIKSFLQSDFTEKEKVTLLITIDGETIIHENKKIKYLGYLSRSQTVKAYSQSEYVILPSLIESFGLPIIEGIKSGSNVLISNIKSLKEVCEPSIVFNPLDNKDIIKAFETASDISYEKSSIITIKNEINTFIQLIINDV